jgi:hypothetical protein
MCYGAAGNKVVLVIFIRILLPVLLGVKNEVPQ